MLNGARIQYRLILEVTQVEVTAPTPGGPHRTSFLPWAGRPVHTAVWRECAPCGAHIASPPAFSCCMFGARNEQDREDNI